MTDWWVLLNYRSAERGTSEASETSEACGTVIFCLKKWNKMKTKEKNLNAVQDFVFGRKEDNLRRG